MNRLAPAALALAGLLLTGCAASPADANVAATKGPAQPAPALTAVATPTPTLNAADAKYIAGVRNALFNTDTPTSLARSVSDESLIAAAHDACRLLGEGTPYYDVTVVDGEQRNPARHNIYGDSTTITSWGIDSYCPEYKQIELDARLPKS